MKLLKFDKPVVLVGGGDIAWNCFHRVSARNYSVVAVDSGARALRQAGIKPHAIVGDLDSISDPASLARDIVISEITEQQTTDFEKALYATDAPLYLGFGFLGKRLDHSLTAIHCIAKYRSQKSIILIDMVDVLMNPGDVLDLELPVGCRLSVFPLTSVKFRKSRGLAYPLDELTLSPGAAVGPSNLVTESRVCIEPVAGAQNDYAVVAPNSLLPVFIDWYLNKPE